MKRFDLSKHITRFVMFLFITCTCLLTSSVFAQLAMDSHISTKLFDDGNTAVSAFVSIDRLTYDPSGAGVAYLDGTFFLHNYHTRSACNYSGDLRLEILEPKGNGTYWTFKPDAKNLIGGNLKKWEDDASLSDIQVSIPESVNLYMDCISGGKDGGLPEAGREYTMSAAITLRVTIGRTTETWAINKPTLDVDFTYERPEETTGLGPTTDGETFADDILGGSCTCSGDDRDWQSLLITEIPYDVVYWYIKEPGDTSYYGTNVETDWGDGAAKRATMTHRFPDDVDDPNEEGNQTAVYYDIGALVYRSDNNIDWHTYKVWVNDKKVKDKE